MTATTTFSQKIANFFQTFYKGIYLIKWHFDFDLTIFCCFFLCKVFLFCFCFCCCCCFILFVCFHFFMHYIFMKYLELRACVCYFWFFDKMTVLQKLWKMLFISSKKCFLFSRYSSFCNLVLPFFSPCRPLL